MNYQDAQVEHLLPHLDGKYPKRKFDWNNLFWSCGHCNNVKNQRIYDEGLSIAVRMIQKRWLFFGCRKMRLMYTQ